VSALTATTSAHSVNGASDIRDVNAANTCNRVSAPGEYAPMRGSSVSESVAPDAPERSARLEAEPVQPAHVGQLLALQRSAGNTAVGRWLNASRAPGRALARGAWVAQETPDAALPANQRRGVLMAGSKKAGTAQDAVFGALTADGCATQMTAIINSGYDDLGGTEPKAGTWPPFWVAPAKPQSSDYWVRGHLLNHNLGGPGEARNLTPITKKTNSQHHALIEKLLKVAAERRDTIIEYRVTATYDGVGPKLTTDRNRDPDPSIHGKLPTSFVCEYVLTNGVTSPVSGNTTIKNEH
jgi:hypothetical protein